MRGLILLQTKLIVILKQCGTVFSLRVTTTSHGYDFSSQISLFFYVLLTGLGVSVITDTTFSSFIR